MYDDEEPESWGYLSPRERKERARRQEIAKQIKKENSLIAYWETRKQEALKELRALLYLQGKQTVDDEPDGRMEERLREYTDKGLTLDMRIDMSRIYEDA